MIRIATFNLENLFTRPSAMNLESDAAGRQAIDDHAELNRIVAQDVYAASDKARLITLSNRYKFHLLDPPDNALVQLQKIRGKLFRKPQNGPLEVMAAGRSDWTGWFELRREDVTWEATYNTGRVIRETHPDILIIGGKPDLRAGGAASWAIWSSLPRPAAGRGRASRPDRWHLQGWPSPRESVWSAAATRGP